MITEYILTFKNTNFVIKAEQSLLANKIKTRVMPLPSQISAGCGLCLRIDYNKIESALGILEEKNINEIGLFSRMNREDKFQYEELSKTCLTGKME